MHTKSWNIKFTSILSLAAMILFIGLSGPASSAEPQELSLSVWSGPEHYHTKLLQAWAKEVETSTGQKVKIVFYPGGTLTTGPQAFNGLTKRISAIASSCNGWTKGRFPLTQVVDLPLGMKTSVQASLVTWDFYNKFRPKEWEDIKVLFMFNHGHQYLHTKQTIQRIQDLKGKRIRSTGNDAIAVKVLGGTPEGMSIGEAYIAMQKGIVDGILCNFGAMADWKLGEVTSSHLDYAVTGCGFWVGMNRDVWNGLSPDVQKVFDGSSQKYVELTGRAWEDADQNGRKYVLGRGNKIVELEPEETASFQKASEPLLNNYVAEMEKLGLPGREALDYTRSLVKKYEGR